MLKLGIILNVSTLSLVAWTWMRRRVVYLLPSSWVLLFSAMFYIVPTLLFADEIADLSPYTWTAASYCASLIGLGVLVNLTSVRFLKRQSLSIAADTRLTARRLIVVRWLWSVLLMICVIAIWYLLFVPLTSTGLYGLFIDPENYTQLREESLKLLDNPPLQYAYTLGFSCLAPLAFALVLERLRNSAGAKRWLPAGAALGFLSFYILLTGARAGLVKFVVVGLFYSFVRNDMRFKWRTLVVGIALGITIPVVLSILREQGRAEGTVLEYFEAIGHRIFLLPLLISGWYVEFAETAGYAGLSAALGFGAPTNWSNLIALEFLDRKEALSFESVTTPTSFFFSNYLYFGWLGLIPSLLALKIIDIPVHYLSGLPPFLRASFAATSLYFSIVFVQAGFGVTLVSHGYLVLIVLMYLTAKAKLSDGLGARDAEFRNEART